MTHSIISILLTLIISSCANQTLQPLTDTTLIQQDKTMNFDFDFLDAYKLKVGDAFLYRKYDNFVANMSLPNKVTVTKTDYTIRSKADLDKIVLNAKEPQIVTLRYPGIDMWYAYDNDIIPSTIDFHKTDKSIIYDSTTFDTAYTVNEFKKQFPGSTQPPFKLPQSLFETMTQEKSDSYEHYILKRKSKSDSAATPMIEFTFDKGKLIYILFANF